MQTNNFNTGVVSVAAGVHNVTFFQKICILSLAEHSDEHVKHLGLSFTKLFLTVKIVAREQNLFFGCVRPETKAGNPSVFALHLCARKLTSFALYCYVIGLFNRAQTNHKHKRKGM